MDGKEGIMVCSENFKNRDENTPENQLWPSEILWQSWTMMADAQGSQPSALKAIVRSTVVNESTQRVIWEAAKVSSCTREGQYHHSEYTDKDKRY